MILCEIWGGTPTTTQEDEVTEVGLQARISTFRTHNFVVAAKQRSAQAAGAAAPATRKKRRPIMMIITDITKHSFSPPKEHIFS